MINPATTHGDALRLFEERRTESFFSDQTLTHDQILAFISRFKYFVLITAHSPSADLYSQSLDCRLREHVLQSKLFQFDVYVTYMC